MINNPNKAIGIMPADAGIPDLRIKGKAISPTQSPPENREMKQDKSAIAQAIGTEQQVPAAMHTELKFAKGLQPFEAAKHSTIHTSPEQEDLNAMNSISDAASTHPAAQAFQNLQSDLAKQQAAAMGTGLQEAQAQVQNQMQEAGQYLRNCIEQDNSMSRMNRMGFQTGAPIEPTMITSPAWLAGSRIAFEWERTHTLAKAYGEYSKKCTDPVYLEHILQLAHDLGWAVLRRGDDGEIDLTKSNWVPQSDISRFPINAATGVIVDVLDRLRADHYNKIRNAFKQTNDKQRSEQKAGRFGMYPMPQSVVLGQRLMRAVEIMQAIAFAQVVTRIFNARNSKDIEPGETNGFGCNLFKLADDAITNGSTEVLLRTDADAFHDTLKGALYSGNLVSTYAGLISGMNDVVYDMAKEKEVHGLIEIMTSVRDILQGGLNHALRAQLADEVSDVVYLPGEMNQFIVYFKSEDDTTALIRDIVGAEVVEGGVSEVDMETIQKLLAATKESNASQDRRSKYLKYLNQSYWTHIAFSSAGFNEDTICEAKGRLSTTDSGTHIPFGFQAPAGFPSPQAPYFQNGQMFGPGFSPAQKQSAVFAQGMPTNLGE